MTAISVHSFKRWIPAILAGILSCACTPSVKRTDGRIEVTGSNGRVLFAEKGKLWAALWKHRSSFAPAHVELSCREKLYLLPFDHDFFPLVKKPVKIIEGGCFPATRYGIVASEEGFDIVYTKEDERLGRVDVRVARFDLKKLALAGTDTVYSYYHSSQNSILSYDALFSEYISFFYRGGEMFWGLDLDGSFTVMKASKGKKPEELFKIPSSKNEFARVFHGSFGRSILIVWFQQYRHPRKGGEVRFLYSKNGRKIDRRGKIHLAGGHVEENINLRVLKDRNRFSVFIVSGSRIFRQQFTSTGAPAGSLATLVREKQDIFNFDAGIKDSACILTYTAGNDDIKYYDCKDREIRKPGKGYAGSMSCSSSECMSAFRAYGKGKSKIIIRHSDP